MRRVIFLLYIFFLPAVCFAQQYYHNVEKHFSFILPKGWEYFSKDKLPAEQLKAIDKAFKSKIEGICQKSNAEHFTTPYVLVQFLNTEDIPESAMEQLFIEGDIGTKKQIKALIERLQQKEGCLPRYWNEAKWIGAEAQYDMERHVSFETANLHHETLGDIIALTVKFLGSHRIITLKCYADGNDSKNNLQSFHEIAGSFTYDKGYGFGGGEGAAPGLIKKLLGGSVWSWIWPILVISIVFWLIRRWVHN